MGFMCHFILILIRSMRAIVILCNMSVSIRIFNNYGERNYNGHFKYFTQTLNADRK